MTNEQIAEACKRVAKARPDYDYSQICHAVAAINWLTDREVEDAWNAVITEEVLAPLRPIGKIPIDN